MQISNQMSKYHKTSPIRTQAIRMFSIIHEISSEQSSTINSSNISKFLNALNLPSGQDLVKFMHKLDKQNKEMRYDYWGYCISRMLGNVYLSSQIDYDEFHGIFKQLLIGVNVQPLESYEMWDGNEVRKMDQRDGMYARIISNYGQMSMFINKIDIMLFTSNLANINTCFSLITLYPAKTEEILALYEKIITGTFLQTLQFSLTTSVPQNILIQMLKSLCYLYQCLKYQKLRTLLKQSFLNSPSTLQGLLQNITDKRPQVRYYTCVLLGLMINNHPKLSQILFQNKKLLYQVSNGVATVAEKQGLMFGIEFLIGVVKSFGKLNEAEKKENMEIITVYLKFAVSKLGQLQSEKSLAACIRLVLQIVKATDLDEQSTKLLKFIDSVFEGKKIQNYQTLFFLVLQICKYSIVLDRKNVRAFIVKDKSFQTYVRNLLNQTHQNWQPFYSCLQIILLMSSQPQLCDILFQRDLIQCIMQLSESSNGLVLHYVSQILLLLIINSMESEWKITYLYEKNCLKCIGQLIANCNVRDRVLEKQFASNINACYFNHYAFVNCLKALHFLNFQTGNLFLLKKQQYVKNFSVFFIQKFSQSVYSFFQSVPNQRYLQTLLKQQHSLSRSPNSQTAPLQKLYKLLSNILQQMTFNLRKRNSDIEILKLVHKARNIIYVNFYGLLNYNELIVQSIPIYLIYGANVNGSYVKQRVYRLSWAEFRSLMWEFVRKAVGVEPEYFQIYQKISGKEIRHQDDYRRALQMVVVDFAKSNFVFEVELTNIREKQQAVNVPPVIGGMGSMRVGSPEQEPFRNIPRFMSYQMPQTRDYSPFGNRRNGGSASRREGSASRRNFSPNFGTPCINCNRSTTNSSKYCNQCIQNRQYR